jgi:predicted unusual protein kinase regulating ubiquinone biosynthesis (AarF/ABC1/UbiB family)
MDSNSSPTAYTSSTPSNNNPSYFNPYIEHNIIEKIMDSSEINYIRNFIFDMVSIFKSLFFICNLFFIFSSEFVHYMIFKNYEKTISRISKRLIKQNVLYVKMFQAFALNKKMIDDTVNKEIIKYCDNAPYSEEDIDWNTLYDISNKYNLNSENAYPINSGMISVVFKLPVIKEDTTSPIEYKILKLKRNNIDYELDEAIERLKFIVKIISLVPQANTLEIPLLFNRNINVLKEQLNFTREVSNIIEMKETCKNMNFIKVPDVYEEITQNYKNAILMEYIDGQKISNIDSKDYNIYAKLVIKYGIINGICNGIFHGDLHSGNILFIKNSDNSLLPKYQLGIIDLGIVMKISDECKNALISIFQVLFTCKPRKISTILFDILLEPKGVLNSLPSKNKEEILNIIENVIVIILEKSKNTNQQLLFDFIINFNRYLGTKDFKKYGIRVNDDFIKFQIGIAMAHGVSMELCKDDLMILVSEVLNEIFHLDVMSDLLKDDDEDEDDEDNE